MTGHVGLDTDTHPEGSSKPRRVAWFHCFSGIAGDMALGSLIDAGADLDEVRSILDRLELPGWGLSIERVLRAGISATRVVVEVKEDESERRLRDVLAILEGADLPEIVRERATRAFVRLATVEAAIHGRSPDEVHFHEVGGHDAIIDIVGTFAALEVLGVDDVEASAVANGEGTIHTRHGILPNPPPAVLALLTGIPSYGRAIDLELTTPTGAVILATVGSRFGPMPAMTVESIGYGAGGRDFDGSPNCTEVVVGTRSARPLESSGQLLTILEMNLDDVPGEQVADTVDGALRAGALDAWVTPVMMKKGRPGQIVSVLCDPATSDAIREQLMSESGSFGVRSTAVHRFAEAREMVFVELEGEQVRVKVSRGRVKVEHDDAAALALRLGRPVREIVGRAETAFRDQYGETR